ncbi:helix-turn-helix transcriptional regulator [Actinophytocola sp.]|uniref:helix-turn-helix transcriptional regulator n=1 Tax=Actinophytocola sp. TaxID=1872138 RepID=UPI00389ADA36
MTDVSSNRRELGRFLRTRRERIAPEQVGLPAGPRRRTRGLRREEVAVLAGLSPTWYTYLEQARNIRPSPEVLDSLARVLQLTEDERRYMHVLVYGEVIHPEPLETDISGNQILEQVVGLMAGSPYPVYCSDQYCDLISWNPAAREWFDDWDRTPKAELNFLRWMLVSPAARQVLVDWENDAQDIVARWRGEVAKWPGDARIEALIAEFAEVSPQFRQWWDDHDVQEHRSRVRRFRHPRLGVQTLRMVVLNGPEFSPAAAIVHIPVQV